MSQGSKVFTVLVVGDNPDELMAKYDINLECEKHKAYKYLDAEKMRKNSIKILSEVVKEPKKFGLNQFQLDALKDRVKNLESMTNFDYYSALTQGMFYDENGDAWTTENPNGKWETAKIGDFFSLPLILKNGNTTHQAKYKDVDWDAMHMQNTHVYEIIWDMVKNGRKPATDKERTLYENMKDKENYFNRFKDVDEYVVHNCAYWNYAFLDKNGWVDIDDGTKDIEWIATYFDKFISNLSDEDCVTIYECTRSKEE